MATKPQIRVNTRVPFPSLVTGSGPITIGKNNGIWNVGLNFQVLGTQTPPAGDFPTDYVIVWDSHVGNYFKMPLSALGSGGSTPTSSIGVVNVKDFGADGNDRLYYNINGGSGYTGGSASNLTPHPEDYTAWTLSNVTVTPNVILDPHGVLAADAITETNAAMAFHEVSDAFGASFTAGSVVRFDVEVKPNLRTWVRLLLSDGSGVFNCRFNLIGNGVVGARFSYAGAQLNNASITPLPNGWYRCSIEGTVNIGITSVKPVLDILLGDLIYDDAASDPNQFYTGNPSAPAIYLGQARVYAIQTYLGSTYIASDNVFTGVALTGGSGTGARANITVGLGQVLNVTSYCPGSGYRVGDLLTCAAADIGGTGSGFSCQVQTVGNDSAAVQAAIDSGQGRPITVYFPPGVYNIFPPDNLGSHCLMLRNNNVSMVGAGRYTTKLQFFVSGGRHPETSYDVPTFGGNANFVWRGRGIQLAQGIANIELRGLRLSGMCKRHNNRYPLGGADPQVISGGNPLGTFGDGDGWDESHQAVARYNHVSVRDTGMRIIDCELDSWKGEIVGSIGDFTTPADDTTQWTWWIERSYIHDTHADCISSSGNAMIIDNEIAWASNGIEEGTAVCHTFMRGNHFHDHTHGITLVVGTDTGAATTSTGQQIVHGNFFERCYRDGVFVFQFQCNVLIDDNTFVDCGRDSSITGGAVNVSLLSGSQPYANVFVRNNLFYNHARNVNSPLGAGAGLFTGSVLKGIYLERNRAAATPNAQSLGYLPQASWAINFASGTEAEFIENDMRIATSHEQIAGVAAGRIENNNLYDSQTNYREIHHLTANFSATNNTTLADITGFIETLSDSSDVWFEAVLFVAATAGGAKVAVVSTAAPFAMRYDVEMWAGTTIDAASGQSTTSGTAFASAASITKIKITGFVSLNYGSNGQFLKLQFAQNSSNATPSSVLPGSWFKVRNAYN